MDHPPRAREHRVIAYIDGFNLYFGLCEAGYRKYLWLNLVTLVERLLKPHQRLVLVKYFTSRISGGSPTAEAKRRRQEAYLRAIATLDNLLIIEGHYLSRRICCNKCQATWQASEEKMTDVNTATQMLKDAFADSFDTAMLISGDSDLVPAVAAVRELSPGKRVVVAFPPRRVSEQLRRYCSAHFVIGKGSLASSQFPSSIVGRGHDIGCPEEWT